MSKISEEVRAIADSVFPQRKQGEEYDEATPEEVFAAFERLETLGQPAFEVVSGHLRLGRSGSVWRLLSAVGEPALKYIDYTLTTGDDSERCEAVHVVGSWESATALQKLKSILWTGVDAEVRAAAARQLVMRGDEGIDAITEALDDENPEVRLAAVTALDWTVTSPADRHELDKFEPLISLLRQALDDPATEVRDKATSALRIIRQLPIDAIDTALDDTSMEIRRTGLVALFDKGITSERSARLVTRAIEDKQCEITHQAIGFISSSQRNIDNELLTNVIIDELVLRESGRPDEYFNAGYVADAVNCLCGRSSRILGQALQRLCDIAYARRDGARRRSVVVASRVSRDEFIAMVNERADQDPSAAQAIRQMLGIGGDTNALIQQLSAIDPGDIQGIAAAQIGLLEKYYQGALDQAKTSFRWAIGTMAIGFLCLLASLVYLLIAREWNAFNLLPLAASALSEYIAYQQFRLYEQTQEQLSDFQRQMDRTQRFLLANSVCESLEDEAKQQTRAQLVRWIATLAVDVEDLLQEGVES